MAVRFLLITQRDAISAFATYDRIVALILYTPYVPIGSRIDDYW